MDQRKIKLTEKHVLESLNISNIQLKNRVGLAPMTRTSASEDGLVTNQIAKYYAKFAKGGFRLIALMI
jgi:2,4-dienoyl-CoA reductase-like NADH-dependent reductase (Old Yellow Enzyme family)